VTPEDLGDLAESLVPVAGRLIAAVRDDGPAVVVRLLADIPATALPAQCVVLAAHGDPDVSSADALSWVPAETGPVVPTETLFGPVWDDAEAPPPLRPSLLHPENWTDDECRGLHSAWRARQRGKGDPDGDPTRERVGFREWDRRRVALARLDPGLRETRNAAERARKARVRARQRAQQTG
jgi:hypothetical protein